MVKLLNLGCGPRFNADARWTNVDFVSSDARVIAHDLLQGLPFGDQSFDAVYHSNVLEHFGRAEGELFIAECFRVLKPGGILRIAVPDLEQICQIYLDALQALEAGDTTQQARYDWIRLEMYDQAIRTYSGGEMGSYIAQSAPDDLDFIVSRAGNIARALATTTATMPVKATETSDLRRVNPKGHAHRLVSWRNKLKDAPQKLRQRLHAKLLSERENKALELGLFRMGGEVHQWMYDVHALRTLLLQTGFQYIERQDAIRSGIADWESYRLDTDADGTEHAPSAIYMEGTKL